MKYRLIIQPLSEHGTIADWEDGILTLSNLVGKYRKYSSEKDWFSSFQRWKERGLGEWVRVGDKRGRGYRHTVISNPDFMPRLEKYLRKTYGFETELIIMGKVAENN